MNSALGSASGDLTINAGTLDLHGFSPTVGDVNGSGGTIRSNVAGNVTFTVGGGGSSGSYSGSIIDGSGPLGLAKTGAGTQTLSGSNTYTGGTTVGGGTLQLGSASSLGSTSGALTVNSGTLDLHAFSPTFGALSGSGGAIQTNVAGAVNSTVGNGGGSGSYSGTVANGSGTSG